MRILITGNGMDEMSGQPVSCYENAKELAKNHDVSVICLPKRWGFFREKLEALGVKCIYEPESEYDLIIASEWKPDVNGFVINTVRSEYDCETPIPNCDFYVGIRPSITEHIIKEHGIPPDKTATIYNGVDRERFKRIEKSHRDHVKIVAPCTMDEIRKKFLEMLVAQSNEKRQVYIYGHNFIGFGGSQYVHIHEPRFDMENIIADADLVVGILLGRVNLEANSCGVKSLVYDPETLVYEEFLLSEDEFDKRHNIKNTIKYLLDIYENNRSDSALHS